MRSRVLLKDRSCPECKTVLDKLVSQVCLGGRVLAADADVTGPWELPARAVEMF